MAQFIVPIAISLFLLLSLPVAAQEATPSQGARQEIRQGRDAAREGKAQVREGRSDVREGKTEIRTGKQDIRETRQDVRKGEVTPQEGKQAIQDTRSRIQTERQNVREARKDVQEGKKEVQEVRSDVRDVRQGARDTRQKLRDEKGAVRAETREAIQEKRAIFEQELREKRERFQSEVAEKRLEVKTKVGAERAKLKERLQTIADEKKKQAVERINTSIVAKNETAVNRFSATLDQLDAVLERINTRASSAEERGTDVSAVRSAIETAKGLITKGREAVSIQAGKTYPLSVSTEATLRDDVSKTRQALHDDLVAVQGAIKVARDAVHTAATTLAQIPNINTPSEAASPEESQATPTSQ